MEFKLDQEQKIDLQNYVFGLIKDSLKKAATPQQPYLNRAEIAKYFGVAPSTITYWASLGMPVAVIDGRKLMVSNLLLNGLRAEKKPFLRQPRKRKRYLHNYNI